MKKIKVGVQAMMLKGKFDELGAYETLKKVSELGFRSVEISQIPMTAENVEMMRAAQEEFGVKIAAVSGSVAPSGKPGQETLTTHFDKIVADCRTNTYTLFLDGQETQRGGKKCFMQGVNRLERLIFRTKPARRLPDLEVMTDTPDLEGTDLPTKERIYFITNVKTESPQAL